MTKNNNFPWATLYLNDAFNYKDGRLMGRHAAGKSYLRAIAESDFESAGFLIPNKSHTQNFIDTFSPFLKDNKKMNVEMISYNSSSISKKYGGIFINDPQVGNYALHRSDYGHSEYSIVGITHTTLSKTVNDLIGDLLIKPVMPWDALICTSSCVKDSVLKLTDYYKEFFSDRFNSTQYIFPELPIIPLGIHTNDFNFTENFRAISRKQLGINENDVVFVFVGRLSFHAKAHPFPMYKSLGNVSKNMKSGSKIHLIQTGWFPNDYIKDTFINDAKRFCPEVICHFLDGRIEENKNRSLACSDIFISLSDNFQETFGITPLEGMASGMPVIVSDWDGYRDTVRDGIDGFTIPTTTLDINDNKNLITNYLNDNLNYDLYTGYASQTVSIDMDLCTDRMNKLVFNKDLRLKMGSDAKKNAEKIFDWKKIVKLYSDLRENLDEIREKSKKPKYLSYPENISPYKIFSSYSTYKLNNNSELSVKGETIIDENHYIITSNTINLGNPDFGFKVEIDIVNEILKVIGSDSLILEKIMSKIDCDKDILKKHIIFLLKFDLLRLNEGKK